MNKITGIIVAAIFVLLCGCVPEPSSPEMEYQAKNIFSMPWPNDIRVKQDGLVDLRGYPGASISPLLNMAIDNAGTYMTGFARNSSVYFHFTGGIDENSLPTAIGSTDAGSPVMLVNLNPNSALYLQRVPLSVDFRRSGSAYTPDNLLSLLPLPGYALEPDSAYAAIVFSGLLDDDGFAITPSKTISDLAADYSSELSFSPEQFSLLRTQLQQVQNYVNVHTAWNSEDIAAFSVFTSNPEVHDLEKIVQGYDQMTPEELASKVSGLRPYEFSYASLDECASNDAYIRLTGTISVPNFQKGEYPYLFSGGAFAYDATGSPEISNWMDLNVLLEMNCRKLRDHQVGRVAVLASGTGGNYLSDYKQMASYVYLSDYAAVQITPHMSQERIADFYDSVESSLAILGLDLETLVAQLANEYSEEYLAKQVISGFAYLNILNPTSYRYNSLQSAAEYLFLKRVFEQLPLILAGNTDSDIASHGSQLSIDSSQAAYISQSQGSSVAIEVLAHDDWHTAFINAGDGIEYPFMMRGDTQLVLSYIMPAINVDELDLHHPLSQILQQVTDLTSQVNFADKVAITNLFIMSGCNDPTVLRESSEALGVALARYGVLDLWGGSYSMKGIEALGLDQYFLKPLQGNNRPDGFRWFFPHLGDHGTAWYLSAPTEYFYNIVNSSQQAISMSTYSAYDGYFDCPAYRW